MVLVTRRLRPEERYRMVRDDGTGVVHLLDSSSSNRVVCDAPGGWPFTYLGNASPMLICSSGDGCPDCFAKAWNEWLESIDHADGVLS